MSFALELSFEMFPPPPGAEEPALACLEALAAVRPRLISVTCGANGAAQAKTAAFIERARAHGAVALAPHMSCIGETREALLARAAAYGARGIRHLVLLRGDAPPGRAAAPAGGFANATELVAAVEGALRGRFELAVAAYPEGHPESAGVAADIDNLARKVAAGAHRAITQFCFDTGAIVRYRDACTAAGLAVPIVPGILPIARFAQLERFAARCGASIPAWLRRRFAGLPAAASAGHALATEAAVEGAAEAAVEVAAEVAAEAAVEIAVAQLEQLRAAGFSAFHFYTLNEAALTLRICEAAGLLRRARAIGAGARAQGEVFEAPPARPAALRMMRARSP